MEQEGLSQKTINLMVKSWTGLHAYERERERKQVFVEVVLEKI